MLLLSAVSSSQLGKITTYLLVQFSETSSDANVLLAAIENRVAASAGAACHSGQVRISHVLEAMHVPEDWARGTLRFSTGRMTAENDIQTAVDVVATGIEQL
jgi:cysteine desulfurase